VLPGVIALREVNDDPDFIGDFRRKGVRFIWFYNRVICPLMRHFSAKIFPETGK
jgi:hypothetical protein